MRPAHGDVSVEGHRRLVEHHGHDGPVEEKAEQAAEDLLA